MIADRAGLAFFFKHVLNKQWDWGAIVKPKRVQPLPDVISYDQGCTGNHSRHQHSLSKVYGAANAARVRIERF